MIKVNGRRKSALITGQEETEVTRRENLTGWISKFSLTKHTIVAARCPSSPATMEPRGTWRVQRDVSTAVWVYILPPEAR